MAFTSKFEEDLVPPRHWDPQGEAHPVRREATCDEAPSKGAHSRLTLDSGCEDDDARARLAFYEKLVEDTPAALFQLERCGDVQSPEYQFTFVATGVRDLLGVSARALEADAFGWLSHVLASADTDARSVMVRTLEHSAATLTPVIWQGYVQIRRSNRWVQVQAHPSRGPQGRVRWTGVFTDITDHKLNIVALEGALADATEVGVKERLRAEALRDTRDELMAAHGEAIVARERVVQREKTVALGRLARGLAHEINNPLSGVQHMVEALRAPQSSGAIDEARRAAYLDQMQAGLVRIESTVSNLLQYAQANVPILAPCDARAWVDESLAHVRPALLEKNVIVQANLVQELVSLCADRQQIVRALVNVLQNAVQASPRGSTLDVDMTRHGAAGVEVSVRDHGAGIPAEYLHRVCDPFFTTKQQGDGNGLGLSVAQQIAAAHGGELRVETREGDGTCVTIRLSSPRQGASCAALDDAGDALQ